MLEKMRYVNSRGEVMDFGAAGIYVNANNLRDWEWQYDTAYNRIRNLRRRLSIRSLPVRIWAETEAQGLLIKNRLHDITAVDVAAGSPGRIYIGDWYQYCYVVKSQKKNYLWQKSILDVTLTLAIESGAWYSTQLETFGGRTGIVSAVVGDALAGFALSGAAGNVSESGAASESAGEEAADTYIYDYPRGYALSANNDFIVNDCVTPCDWRIVIQGPAANPSITIGDAIHRLNYEIPTGAAVTIDSRKRTIILTRSDGTTHNLFRYRDKDHDIFARIESGTSWLQWNGEYHFSIELLKERSEPLWT